MLSGFEAIAKMIEDGAKWLSDQIQNSLNVYCLDDYRDENELDDFFYGRSLTITVTMKQPDS